MSNNTKKTLAQTLALVCKKFENVTRSDGSPYAMHCIRVMQKVKHHDFGTTQQIHQQCALLHDIVEDGFLTMCDIKYAYGSTIAHIVGLLTHDKKVPYMAYIEKLKYNDVARRIKMADLEDNSRVTHQKGTTNKDKERIWKYHEAYAVLKAVEDSIL